MVVIVWKTKWKKMNAADEDKLIQFFEEQHTHTKLKESDL